MCGVATILQIMNNRFFGIGLPVVLGCTFTAVAPMIAIGKEFGISAIYGAIIVSGLFIIIISTFFGHPVRFFPPVVTGSVVTIIGMTLIPVAINNVGGGPGASDFGSMTIFSFLWNITTIIILYRFSTGFIACNFHFAWYTAGTIAAMFMGIVDLCVKRSCCISYGEAILLRNANIRLCQILTMTLVAMVSLVESTGVYFALGDICKKVKKKDLERVSCRRDCVLLGGLFNAFPYTTFSQNVGLVQMSGVKSRKVILITG